MAPSRKILAAVGAGIALVLVYVLAVWFGGVGGGRGRITIRFWNGFTGPDGRTMLRLVKRFNHDNPDVHVLMQRMDWSTYYNKLFVASIGGRAPEVFVVHNEILPRFTRAGLLRPMDDLVKAGRLDTADIDPNIWQSVYFGGVPMAVPLDVHPLGLYYNKALLREAGLVGPDGEARPPTNRREFVDALRRLRKDGQWGFVFTWLRTNVFAIFEQFGGRLFTDDLSRCTLDDPANVRALEFCVELINEGLVPPPQSIDSWIGFRQGKVGMVFEGIYMLADLERQGDLPYAGAPIPQLGERRATWVGSHSLCLQTGLEGRALEASWRFIRFLSDNSLDWAEGGQVPVRRSLRRTPRFEAMTVQRRFAEQIPYLAFKPRVPFVFEFDTEFDLALERALRGRATPREALEEATRRVNAIIERDREIHQQARSVP